MSELKDDNEIELEEIASEETDTESSPPNYQISTYPADYTLEVLHQKWLNDEIEIPEFQRNFVWTQTHSSKLIESFLIDLPVPAIFLYTERNSQNYLVIDGQQRLRTVFDYLKGKFDSKKEGRRPVFKLKGLNEKSKFYEKSFEALSDYDKKRLKNSILRAFIVRQLDPDDDTSMYHIFERLNTGGTKLVNQEIRNCVYHGKFSKFLDDINMLGRWRAILGKPVADRRKRDVELILRFFALRNVKKYKSPMKDYLNRFMRRNMDPGEKDLRELRRVFEETCDSVVNSLGEKPFHVRTGLNAAVFDAVMVAFSNRISSVPSDVKERFKKLLEDDEFESCTKSNTTNDRVVAQRFLEASRQLFGQ